MSRKIFGGGKKKAAAAPAEVKGPTVTPLTPEALAKADPRKRRLGLPTAFGPTASILSDKLGG